MRGIVRRRCATRGWSTSTRRRSSSVSTGPSSSLLTSASSGTQNILGMKKKKLNCFLQLAALQRQNAENLKQIFPEKEYRVSVPISTFMCL
jgi:hypothetical protein